MQLPIRIKWERLFEKAAREGLNKHDISDATGISVNAMYCWCNGTEPKLGNSAAVFNYLLFKVPGADECLIYSHKKI